jgi:NAD(P)H-quinone oxidoreductase subunit 5
VRVDVVTCVMLLLVCGLGAAVARYSRAYLQGDAGLDRFFRWLLLTLSAVTTLVVANSLLVIALGWTATSLCLHQLLTYYSDRPAALVAAHKKFLVSRLADLCMVAALVLVERAVGGLGLDRIAAWAAAHPQLTPSMHVAAALVVVAVALRSAQLPFHGWLIQVMEAPTPVSALLHAGVANLGGFVLIRLAPWMAHARAAQLLLVLIGLASAVIAALVMTTRVSVKVALAWSTCAQMGFMLVQCGLGLWHLALLHLVAHSLYKAHAFLSAGSAVDEWRERAAARAQRAPSLARAAVGGLAAVGAAALLVALWPSADPAVAVLALMVSLSMLPLLARGATVAALARAGGVALLYVASHAAASRLVAAPVAAPNALGWALVGSGFVALFAVKTALDARPDGPFARALYPWLFAGLYLDERFTRLTFRVWPLPAPRRTRAALSIEARETVEART